MKSLIFVLFLFSLAPLVANSQPLESYLPTEKLDSKKKGDRKKNRPIERQRIRYIVKNYNGKILYGNPCWLEETRQMGFEYVIQKPGIAGSVKPWRKIWDNTKTITNLILTKSPFWKMRLNRKIKDCRRKSGDLVG